MQVKMKKPKHILRKTFPLLFSLFTCSSLLMSPTCFIALDTKTYSHCCRAPPQHPLHPNFSYLLLFLSILSSRSFIIFSINPLKDQFTSPRNNTTTTSGRNSSKPEKEEEKKRQNHPPPMVIKKTHIQSREKERREKKENVRSPYKKKPSLSI